MEKLTKPDILAYVDAKLWSDTLIQRLDGRKREGVEEIANFITLNAKGVFLWVVLTMNIVLDGINSYEDPLVIRDRVMKLPPGLGDLFDHILSKRIPMHHAAEAARYLLITLRWEAENLQASLLAPILNMAQKAYSYEMSCSIAASKPSQVDLDLADFANRLRNRCQGLLELVDPLKGPVAFLHRTLFDYLNEEEAARGLLSLKTGSTFEVYSATMAAISCLNSRDMVSLDLEYARIFFRFNALSEEQTCRHRSELVEIFDQTVIERKIAEPDYLGARWPNSLIQCHEMLPRSDMVAIVIYTGGSLHLREAIARNLVSSIEDFSRLLHYAVPPQYTADTATGYRKPLRPQAINIRAAALLLELGADPTYVYKSWSPWYSVLARLIVNTNLDQVLELVDLVVLFAKHTSCREKRRRASTNDSIPEQYTASEAIQTLLLEKKCCSSKLVRHCWCIKAQKWRISAVEAQQLIDNLT
jgi:hypothetical protein